MWEEEELRYWRRFPRWSVSFFGAERFTREAPLNEVKRATEDA